MKKFFFTFIICAIILPALIAQTNDSHDLISVESLVDRDKITIGDLVNYKVIIQHDPDIVVEAPPVGANLGMFEIRDYNVAEPRNEKGQVINETEYSISTFETGEFEIPPIVISYTVPGDTVAKELKTESIKITVESMKPSEEGDIRDIKMPLEIPRSYRQIIFISVIALLIIAIAVLIYILVRRVREGKGLIPQRAKPIRPPHEIALEELEKLISSDLLVNGEIKTYYITLSEIIRQYIEGRFFIIALEMTTTQLLEYMRNSSIDTEVIKMSEEFLDSCDLVKFAKYIPTEEETRKVTQQAFDFVDNTKLVISEEKVTTEDADNNINVETEEAKVMAAENVSEQSELNIAESDEEN